MNETITQQGCPIKSCTNHAKVGEEYIAIHDAQQNRFRCRKCRKTWSGHRQQFQYGLRTESIKIRRALEMLKSKIPIRIVAQLIKISPSTVMRWKKKMKQFQ